MWVQINPETLKRLLVKARTEYVTRGSAGTWEVEMAFHMYRDLMANPVPEVDDLGDISLSWAIPTDLSEASLRDTILANTHPDSLVRGAALFALGAHRGQLRKYTDEPYIVHPWAVANTLCDMLFDEEVVAAAWLHDVVEDTQATNAQLATLFGARVAQLVSEVTNVTLAGVTRGQDGNLLNRAARAQTERAHLSDASPDGQNIKLADLIDNTTSIVKYDPAFAPVYLAEKEATLMVLSKGDAILQADAWEMLKLAKEKLKEKVE